MSFSERRQAEHNLKAYKKIIAKSRRYDYVEANSEAINTRITELRKQVIAEQPKTQNNQISINKDIIAESFAIVTAVIKQTFGWDVFESQLLAAAAMQRGRVIELDTGEGKTLVAVFVACLRYLAGQNVHVLTFNDYLAERDANWMKPLYDRLGMKSAYIKQSTDKEVRRQAYKSDVLYITAKEAGFDFLRGFLIGRQEDLIQTDFGCAIVDEADSILIDEARIPLVLASAESGTGTMDPALFSLVKKMRSGMHFRTDKRAQQVLLTEKGQFWLEKCLGIENIYESDNSGYVFQIRNMLQALHILRKDIDYIIRDEKIELVDEFTGRVIKDRQLPEGLHEAVELKEGLKAKSGGNILNRITLRDFLGLYPFMCGMTGTAVSSAREFRLFFDLGVTRIPPHIPCCRVDYPDLIFAGVKEKEQALLKEIQDRHQKGQPILMGTASVEESERLAKKVEELGLKCEVLNARHDDIEAEIIARAGNIGAITISTNMAGRGVDIIPEDKKGPGLYVIGTNKHRSVRIDKQLRGRAGRQGDPGESRFFLSLEDDLIERYRIRSVLPPEFKDIKTEQPITDKRVHLAMDHTQRVVEGQLFQQRQNLLRYAMLVEEQRQIIYKLHHDILTGNKKLTIWQDILDQEETTEIDNNEEIAYQEGASSQEDISNQDNIPLQNHHRILKLNSLMAKISAEELQKAQQQAGAMILGQCWADYLEFVDQLLDHISLMKNGPTDSLTIFNRQIIEAYTHLLDEFEAKHIALLDSLEIKNGKIDLHAAGLANPPSTRSYLIDDGSDTLDKILGISDMVAAAANPGFFLLSLTQRWNKK